jgi:beta-lactamase regulating signal transducer with metallopeptidase domain
MTLLFVEAALKSSFLLAAAATINMLLSRRMSAASRHLVWTLAIVGLLLLPILSAGLPSWDIAIPVVTSKVPDAAPIVQPTGQAESIDSSGAGDRSPTAATAVAPTPSAAIVSLVNWATLSALYAAGVLLLLIRLATERRTVQRLARQASDVSDPEWTALVGECAGRMGVQRPVRLLRSLERTMPMAFGTRVPVILIPSVGDTWSQDRRRAVLLHELAHVARHDCLTQLMASVACAVYWIHPGVWWIARRLRVERELACDDRVLGAGTHAREYAGHLLELAYTLGSHRAPALAVTMARPRQLEGRLLAVLDAARNRAVPALRSCMAGAALTAALLVPLAAAQGKTVQSTWEIRPANTAGTVRLTLTDGDSNHSFSIPIAQLEGISPAMLSGAGGPVQFSLRRDAGTFSFEGALRFGVGAGTYTFAPSASFSSELAKRGLARPTAAQQYALARNDIGFAFLDELTAQGYARPDASELVAAAEHGVHLDYLREMGRLGYRLGVLESLIRQWDHGVSPQFIRELGAQGVTGLSPDDILRTRDHGVSPEYVRDLGALGYQKLALGTLIQLRDHGVDPEYVRGLGALGYEHLSLDSLIRLRDHGVDPQYVQKLKDRGQGHLTIDELIERRDRGETPDPILSAINRIHYRLVMNIRAMLDKLAASRAK